MLLHHPVQARAQRHQLHALDRSSKPIPPRVCLGRSPLSPPKSAAHRDSVQLSGLGTQAAADVQHVEKGLVPYTVQQVLGEVADVVLPEVPPGEDARGDAGLGVGVAAVTEVLAQVFAVPQPLHKLCGARRK